MRSLVLGCVVFLVGAWFGFYEAHAASGIKYSNYMLGKDAAKAEPTFLYGYVAGLHDMLTAVTWFGNESPKDFTAELFTKQYQCMQKIPNAAEAVAWAKDFWNKEPDVWAGDNVFIHACEYNPSARANTMVKTGGRAPHAGGRSMTLSK